MAAVWITRDNAGVITAAYTAAHCDPATLRELRQKGRTPELVDAGPGNGVLIGAPLRADARVIEQPY